MILSKRKEDSEIEKVMQGFFSKAYEKMGFDGICRTSMKNEQLKGVDVYLSKEDKTFIVDEKCATNYFYKELKTFAFELKFRDCYKGVPRNQFFTGWFADPDKITDYYALGYVRANSKDDLKAGRVTSFECLIVSRKEIENFILRTLGVLDINAVIAQFEQKIDQKIILLENDRYTQYLTRDIKIVKSMGLAEEPLNIIISKYILKKLSIAKIII